MEKMHKTNTKLIAVVRITVYFSQRHCLTGHVSVKSVGVDDFERRL